MPKGMKTFSFTINANLGNGFTTAFDSASGKISGLASQMRGLGNIGKEIPGNLGKRLAAVGTTGFSAMALGFGKSIASSLSEASKEAVQFESSMADVRKVVDFDSEDQFKEMGQDIIEMSKNIPMTADNLAQIVAAGGQSGIVREDLAGFAESAAKMGVAFDISADQAGDMMAKWRTAFKMSQNDVVGLADKINYLGNTTAASAPLISDVVTRIGPLGEIGGVASGEIAALGASMVGSGIESDVAATGIKNMILSLTAGDSATKSQAEAFAKLGLNAQDMAQYMQDDAKGAILQVLDAIASLDKVDQASVLSNLFGKESLGAIAPLLSNLDGLKENFDKVSDATQYAGSMEGEFDTRSRTTANSLVLMNNRLNASKIAIGQGLIPVITPAIELLSSAIGVVSNFAQQNQEVVKWIGFGAAAIGIFVGAVGAIGSVVGAFETVYLFGQWARAAGVATKIWAGAQWLLNAAMGANPIGLVIAGIAALIAIGYVLYSNWEEISAFASSMWEGAKDAVAGFGDYVEEKIGEICDWAMDKWQSLKDFLAHPIDTIVRVHRESMAEMHGENVDSNASGGIYPRGEFLTTFAEDSPEAAIPIDGSRRAAGLWTKTGQDLGLLGSAERSMIPDRNSHSMNVVFNPTITIQGNADAAVVQQAMRPTVYELKRMLQILRMDERRHSYE